jgi:hypothetical protein
MLGCGIAIAAVPAISGIDLVLLGNGEIEISGSGATLNLTVSGTGVHDGNYVLSVAQLDDGPVNLSSPIISGTGTIGEDVTLVPGLWIYDASSPPPVVDVQWRRDGATISGAMGTVYTPVATDAGTQLDAVETATTVAGSRTATTNAIDVAAALTIELTETASFVGTSHQPSHTFDNVSLGSVGADREIYLFVSGFCDASAVAFEVSVGGQSCTVLTQRKSTDNFAFLLLAKLDVDPGTSTADVTVSLPNSRNLLDERCAIAVMRVEKPGGTTLSSSDDASSVSGQNFMTVDVAEDGFLLASAFKSGNTFQPSFTGVAAQGAPWPEWSTSTFMPFAFEITEATETGRSVSTIVNDFLPTRHMSIAAAIS